MCTYFPITYMQSVHSYPIWKPSYIYTHTLHTHIYIAQIALMIRNGLIIQKEKYKIPNRKSEQINGEFRKEGKIGH